MIEENGDDVLIVPLMLIMIYSFVFMITKRNGFGMLLCFESSTILAMVIGLTAQYSIGHKFSALTLSLILSFVLCSTIMLLLAFYMAGPKINLRAIYLKHINYFIKTVARIEKFILLLFIVTCAYAYKEMFSSGNYFREFYRNLVLDNELFLITIISSLGVILCLYYCLTKKYFIAVIIILILASYGKKNPMFIVALLGIIHLFFTKKNLLLPISIGVLSILLLLKLAMIQQNIKIPLLTQLSSTLDYTINFNYFVENFPLGSLGGKIFITEFIKYIPRAIWEQKPTVYSILLIHEKLYPAQLAVGYTPGIFSAYAKYLADFGIFGLIPYSIFRFCNYFIFLKATSSVSICVLCYSIDNTLLPVLIMIFGLSNLKKTIGNRITWSRTESSF